MKHSAFSPVELPSGGSGHKTFESRFWVGSAPFFSTELFLEPLPYFTARGTAEILLFDSSGAGVNTVFVSSLERQPTIVDLDHLMLGCKYQSGIKHGQMLVRTQPGLRPYCRINADKSWSLSGDLSTITESAGAFYPLTISAERSSFLCVVNSAADAQGITVRLFIGSRMPEVSFIIPAMGSRIISIQAEFAEYLKMPRDGELKGYIRVRTRSKAPIGLQMIENIKSLTGAGVYKILG